MNFVRPKAICIFDVHDPHGVKYLSRLRVGLSHLREHKFKHGFLDTINPLCPCGQGIESTKHFFLHCSLFQNLRATFFENLDDIDNSITNANDDAIVETILFRKPSLGFIANKSIIESTINYIRLSERFEGALF